MKIFKTLILFSFIYFIAIGCSEEKTEERAEKLSGGESNLIKISSEQFSVAKMKLDEISSVKFSKRIKVTGTVDVPPSYKADVSVYYGGTVKKVNLLPGQFVKKGDPLFVMENPEYVEMQRDFLIARNKLEFLKSEYERQTELFKDKVTSQKKFAKIKSDYFTSLSEYNSLEKRLRLLNINTTKLTYENISTTSVIFSPLNGNITSVNITRGQYLEPSTVAVSIISKKHLHLELKVFEKDISKIKKGQPVVFFLPDNPQKRYNAEVFLVGKAISGIERTVNVHGHLKDNKISEELLPGMYIEAEIFVDELEKPALPTEAIVKAEGVNYILVLNSFENGEYTFEKKEIKTGESNDGYTEVLTPEVIGTKKVLIKGAFNLIQ